ncbi:Proteasome subunit alpha type [Rhynchospora pubera]|uniref:Proteasome subunit alpha type n=1 Tax=Rhynchospora pubera TaxID=906938 RepID=A0AAV8GAF5_9POAL|nr:Proteasome subunit alpha type [Rhynchospora pubera]KAJ4800371.1 Proteasome subunit alpha type [Rhynchospora pubera]
MIDEQVAVGDADISSLSEWPFELPIGVVPILSDQTCVGIKVKDGVVIAADRKLPCSKYGGKFDTIPRVQAALTKLKEPASFSDIMALKGYRILKFKESRGLPRSFGFSLLYCGYDDDGPQLCEIDTPNQMNRSWKVTAKGVNASAANAFLHARYAENASIEEATNLAVSTLKNGFGRPISGELLEVGIIGSDRKFRVLSQTEVDECIAAVP